MTSLPYDPFSLKSATLYALGLNPLGSDIQATGLVVRGYDTPDGQCFYVHFADDHIYDPGNWVADFSGILCDLASQKISLHLSGESRIFPEALRTWRGVRESIKRNPSHLKDATSLLEIDIKDILETHVFGKSTMDREQLTDLIVDRISRL